MLEGIWWVSYVGLWILVLLEAMVILTLTRQIGLLHLRVGAAGARIGNSGPELGERAPEIRTYDLNSDQMVTLAAPLGKSTMLVFISPGCSSCDGLMPGVVALSQHEHDTEFILVSEVTNKVLNRKFIERHRLNSIKFIADPKVTEQYRIGGSPYAVLVDSEGVVRTKGLVNHLEHLESLLNARDSGFPSFDSKMNALVSNKRGELAA